MRTIIAILLSVSTFPIFAQSQFEVKDGWYIGAGVPHNSLAKDFNGERLLASAEEVIAVPQLKANVGWGIIVGYRSDATAVEFSYLRSEHAANWLGTSGDAIYSIWNLDFKYYWLKKTNQIQPFVQLGWSPVMPLRLRDGAATVDTSPVISDAIYVGSLGNFNAGVGLAYYFSTNVSINGAVLYRKAKYKAAESEEKRNAMNLEEDLDGDYIGFMLYLSYTF